MMTLAEARKKAKGWLDLLDQGIDPAAAAKAATEAAAAAEKATIAAALEVYCKRKLSKLRSGRIVEATLQRVFKDAGLLARPLAEITDGDIRQIVYGFTDRGFEGYAHQVFALIRAFFGWVVDSKDFGLSASPCAGMKPKVLIGSPAIGDRVLSEAEIAAYLRAANAMPYPDGAFLKLLMLTACRRGEVADMRWREIEGDVWVIPSGRMKGKAAHAVPLVPAIRELLESLPRFPHGDFVFSNFGGIQPIAGFGRIQARLHKAMRADLGADFKHFTLHDVRRSCRTQFSKLRISGETAEALLAHAKPGLHRVYNLHDIQTEKAEALCAWHDRLQKIAPPPPRSDNVVPIRAA